MRLARLLSLVVATSVALGNSGARAAGETRTLQNILPPSLNPNVANFGNLFDQCGYGGLINPTVNAVASVLKKKDASSTAVTLETPCEPFAGGAGLKLACEDYKTMDGQWDSDLFGKTMKTYERAENSLSCRAGKLELIQSELECFKRGQSALEQQISQLKSEFTNNIQRMQSEVTQMQTYVIDRDRQIGEVDSKLNGDGRGMPGVRQLKEEVRAVLIAVHEQVHSPDKGIKARVIKAQYDHVRYKEDVKIRTMALTVECFKGQPISSLKCDPNGGPVNAYEFAKCSVERYGMLGKNGQIERDAETAARARGRAASIAAELDRIFVNAPNNPNVPAMTQEQAQAGSNQSTRYLEPSAINWSRFEAFNIPGLKFNIRQTLQQSMDYCYKNSASQVRKETLVTDKGRSGSALAIAAMKIQSLEEATQQMTNRVIQDYELQYQKINATLTGSSVPLNTARCKNASPARQVACLEEGYNALEDLLLGKSGASEQTMFFRANNQAMNIELKCRGLTGCETALSNMRTNLNTDREKVAANKKNYIQKANQQIEQFTEQMARNFSPQSQFLRDRLEKIKGSLAGLGIRDLGLSLTEMEGEALQKGQDQDGEGLYQNPKNVLALIGSQATPPMVKIDALNGPIGSVADSVEKIEEQEDAISEARVKLKNMESSCKTKDVIAASEGLRRAAQSLEQCFANLQYECDMQRTTGLTALIDSIDQISSRITGTAGSISDVSGSLDGAKSHCQTANNRFKLELDVLKRKKDSIAGFRDAKIAEANAAPIGSDARGNATTKADEYAIQIAEVDAEIKKRIDGLTGQTAANCVTISANVKKELEEVQRRSRGLTNSQGAQ
jgi:hypothetical protein